MKEEATRVYSRFDIHLIDLVRPRYQGASMMRKLDALLHLVQLGDEPRFQYPDNPNADAITAFIQPQDNRWSRSGLTIRSAEFVRDALHMALLGHSYHPQIEAWRAAHNVDVRARHRVIMPHVRERPDWYEERLWRFIKTYPWPMGAKEWTENGGPLGVPLNPVHADARTLGDVWLEAHPKGRREPGRRRRWAWRVCFMVTLTGSGWDYVAAEQKPGETLDSMLTRAFNYLESIKKDGAAFVDTSNKDVFGYGVFREVKSSTCCDAARRTGGVKHWMRCGREELVGPLTLNEAVAEATRLNGGHHDRA